MVAVEESQIQSERFLPRSVSFVTVWREDACSLALSVGLQTVRSRSAVPVLWGFFATGGGGTCSIDGSDTSVLVLLCV